MVFGRCKGLTVEVRKIRILLLFWVNAVYLMGYGELGKCGDHRATPEQRWGELWVVLLGWYGLDR